MSDLKKYIAKREKTDKEFAEGFEEGYEQLKLSVASCEELRSLRGTNQFLLARLPRGKPR